MKTWGFPTPQNWKTPWNFSQKSRHRVSAKPRARLGCLHDTAGGELHIDTLSAVGQLPMTRGMVYSIGSGS